VLQFKPKVTHYDGKQDTVLVKGGMTAGKVMESDGAKVENITGADYDLGGSPTNAEVRDVSKHMTMISRTSFIAGHMLNKHLGGAVTDNKNITSISASANSQESKHVEEPAKAAVRKPGSDVTYYTRVVSRGTVGPNDQNHAQGHAIAIESGFEDKPTGNAKKEVIDVASPVNVVPGAFAAPFDMSGVSNHIPGYESVRLAALEYCPMHFETEINPAELVKELGRIVGGTRANRTEAEVRKVFPHMPDRVLETFGTWYEGLGAAVGGVDATAISDLNGRLRTMG
jgi:hypothetical protein